MNLSFAEGTSQSTQLTLLTACRTYSIFKSCVKCFAIFYGQHTVYPQARSYFASITPLPRPFTSSRIYCVLHLVLRKQKSIVFKWQILVYLQYSRFACTKI